MASFRNQTALGALKVGRSLRKSCGTYFLVFLIVTAIVESGTSSDLHLTENEKQVLNRFQSYLRIETAHPNPDYYPVTSFLVEQGKLIGLDAKVFEFVPKKPVVLLTWKGTDPSLPSVLFNSHSDVVPAEQSRWVHPPYDAHIDEDGKLFARGSQDMKCVGMQYLEAIRNLKAAGFKPLRSIHLSFVPDEEIGGEEGAEKFVQSEQFKELNVAAAMDEGLASPDNHYRVFYGERTVWWISVKAHGSPAHGSRMIDGMALENLRYTLNKVDEFRKVQFDKVKSGQAAEGDVVSINNVFLKAGTPTPTGFVMNLQPFEAEAGFDMRLPPIVDIEALEKLIVEEWAPATRNLTYSFIQKRDVMNKFGKPAVTVTDDTNPWWVLLKESVTKSGGVLGKPEIFMASTDARFVRYEGIPSFGFSPMANTPILLHDHNEFLHVREYLKGIAVYEEIMKAFTGTSSPDVEEPLTIVHSEL